MAQEPEARPYERGGQEGSAAAASDVAALRAENERLKTLVIELTAIIAKSVVDRK